MKWIDKRIDMLVCNLNSLLPFVSLWPKASLPAHP